MNINVQNARSRTRLYVTTRIKGKAAFVESKNKWCGSNHGSGRRKWESFEKVVPGIFRFRIHRQSLSLFVDRYFDSTSYFFTRGHVAFIDYPRHYAKASKTPFELYLSRTVKSFAVTLLDVGRNRGLSLSLALAKGRNARAPLLWMRKIEVYKDRNIFHVRGSCSIEINQHFCR